MFEVELQDPRIENEIELVAQSVQVIKELDQQRKKEKEFYALSKSAACDRAKGKHVCGEASINRL